MTVEYYTSGNRIARRTTDRHGFVKTTYVTCNSIEARYADTAEPTGPATVVDFSDVLDELMSNMRQLATEIETELSRTI